MDLYTNKFLKAIKKAVKREQTDKEQGAELSNIINKIYDNGFEDGTNNQ